MVEWKKIGGAQEAAEFELYDYLMDPRELENVAAKNPSVVDRLKKILARHPEPRKLAKQ